MIIPHEQANDTLVIILSKPSTIFQSVYYGLLLLFVVMIAWSYWSIIGITIQAQGSIRPSDGIQPYTALFNTMVESVYVVENQRIQKGDTLLALSSADVNVQLRENNRQHIEITKEIHDLKKLIRLPAEQSDFWLPHLMAEYDAIQKELKLNDVDISTNENKFHRSREMKNKNLISDVEHEDVERSLKLSQTKRESFLINKISSYRASLFTKEAALSESFGNAQLLSEERRKRYIIANLNGYVCLMNVKKGGVQAVAGQELCAISPSTKLQTEFFVPAKDIGFIGNGFPVHYEIDAYPFQEWGFADGVITSISNDIISDSRTGNQYFKVIGSINNETLYSHRYAHTAQLKRGLNFRVIVKVAEKRLLEMVYDKTLSYFIFHK